MPDSTDTREAWLRGPLPDVPSLLQPVAHALVQARTEIHALMADVPDALLWERPAGVAAPAFHLRHIPGVIDRLFTYARGEALSATQLASLRAESQPASDDTADALVAVVDQQVERALAQLRATPESALTEPRGVGRAQLPSTVLGLLSHAAEHTMRHVGQLLVTVRVLRG